MPTNIRSKSVSEIGNLKLQIPITLLIVAVAAAVLVLTQTTATNPTPAAAQSGQTSTLGEPLVDATTCGSTNGLANRIEKVTDAIVTSVNKDIAAANIIARNNDPSAVLTPYLDDCSEVTTTHMAAITTLDLRRLELRELRAADLAGLTSLQELYVSNNSLTSLNANTFSSLTTLTDLDLGNNQLDSVHQNLFDGLTNLRRVALDNNRLSSVHEDIFDGLTSLRTIELQRNKLTSLDADIFDGLTSLRRLYLESNSLTTLPSNIFSGLSLTRLNLANNGLTSLPTISNFGSYLTNLDLEFNALTSLPSLSGFSNLDSLDIKGNSGLAAWFATNTTPFSSNTNLTELNMSQIVTEGGTDSLALDESIFDGLSSLWELNLSGNRLSSLHEDIFEDPYSIGYLYLNNNSLTSLHEDIFEGFDSIEELNLSSNKLGGEGATITTLHEDIFEDIGDADTLESLYLDDNRFFSLNANLFDDFSGDTLLDLGLSFNSFQSLDANILPSGITHLYLNDNRLNGFPTNSSSLTSLMVLNLYRNSIGESSLIITNPGGRPDVPSLSSLKVLRLGLTDTTSTAFQSKFPNLEILQVPGGCDNSALEGRTQAVIDAITADVATRKPAALNNCAAVTWTDLASVETLDLSNKNIGEGELKGDQEIVGDFEGLTGLTSLDLSNNDLTRLTRYVDSGRNNPDGTDIITAASAELFVDLGALTELNLCDNKLSPWTGGPTGVLSGLGNLETLRLCNNRLTVLTDAMFDSVPNLQNLYLNGNRLSRFVLFRPGVFATTPDLRILDLQDSDIEYLHVDTFMGLSNLRTLHLKLNPIGDLPLQVLSPLTSLRTLSINHGAVDEQTLRNIRPNLQVEFEGAPAIPDTEQRPGEPTWTPTAVATDTPIPAGRILRIKPSVESISIRAGSKVRLSVGVFGLQNEQDDSLAEKEEVTFEWSSSNGEGSFEESAPAGAETNGEPDDRKVLHTVSDIPGTYTVTATLGQGECRGTDEQCSATVRITVIRTIVREASATPVPCQISGTIPAAIPDSAGNQHSVFTPTDGGTFTDENVEVTAPINAVAGCEYIGIRVVESGPAMNRNNPLYRYTLAGMLYSVQAVDSSGATITDYQFNRPIQVCVPLPGTLRGNISEIDALKLNSDGTLTALTSKILSTPNGSPRVCGNLSELPADIAAGKRGAPDPTPEPMPTATPEPPETGGTAVPYTWAWLIAILGVGVFVLGAATLTRRRETTTATIATADNDNTMFLNRKS